MKRSVFPSLGLALVLAGGCVSAKDYEALEADLAKARDELSGAREDIKSLRVALEETENEVELLNGRIGDLEDELRVAEVRASEAETELAAVLKDKGELTESIDDMQAALAELKRQRARAEVRAALYRAVLDKFKAMIDSGTLEAKIVDGRMVLELKTDILFPSGSAKLSDQGVETIREVGSLLAQIPERRFQVEGHTDNVPINTKTYPSNWELAAARAITVLSEMVDAGMPADRISAASFADTRPRASNQTEEGRAQNRRIEIVIVPDLSQLPGAEELEKRFGGASA
jgi:chemotaxis protein MotB